MWMLESKFNNAREKKTIFLSLEATSIVVFFVSIVLYFRNVSLSLGKRVLTLT